MSPRLILRSIMRLRLSFFCRLTHSSSELAFLTVDVDGANADGGSNVPPLSDQHCHEEHYPALTHHDVEVANQSLKQLAAMLIVVVVLLLLLLCLMNLVINEQKRGVEN
jgi:hypothetical protein